MKKYIPNFLTCCNLAAGCVAAVMAFRGDYPAVLLCIVLSAVFDFFDGMAARMLNVHSPIGKDLDSLADDVSFGFAPAALVFSWLHGFDYSSWPQWLADVVPFAAFLLAVFSALRLAKFNIDTRQRSSFIGLAVPANALFWAALVVSYRDAFLCLPSPWGATAVLLLVVVFSVLMVSEIPMFSLKFKNLSWHDNAVPYSFLLGCVLLLLLMGTGGVAFSIVWYVLLSVATSGRMAKKEQAN
ncbi:MAG: CDP-diacylglycerol--serine O-phosphatidyltransferase [Bacteroidaceae bacterium]|jgi:CDP-diacylglycerol--serine O-phosphatidyltransferase